MLAQSQDFQVQVLDLVVIIAYLVVTIGIGWWYSARSGGNEDSEGDFLGGRNFVWPFIGFSLLATNMSGMLFAGALKLPIIFLSSRACWPSSCSRTWTTPTWRFRPWCSTCCRSASAGWCWPH